MYSTRSDQNSSLGKLLRASSIDWTWVQKKRGDYRVLRSWMRKWGRKLEGEPVHHQIMLLNENAMLTWFTHTSNKDSKANATSFSTNIKISRPLCPSTKSNSKLKSHHARLSSAKLLSPNHYVSNSPISHSLTGPTRWESSKISSLWMNIVKSWSGS